MTREEVLRFVGIITRLCVDRLRLTGGEPLLREDIVDIIRALKGVPTVREITLTTNGSRLTPLLKPLKEAGLDRLNISLDSLDALRFKRVTCVDAYEEVFYSVFEALRAGFPVKVNVVVLKDLAAREILQFAKLAYEYPLEVRFLEFMPLCGDQWDPSQFKPIREVRDLVTDSFTLEEKKGRGGEVAQVFFMKGGKGRVGFIGSLTEPFCSSCSRIRLSADGRIRPCLFAHDEVRVGDLLKRRAPEEEIVRAIRIAVSLKPKGNPFIEQPFDLTKNIGGEILAAPLIRAIGG